ncbi:MAG: hypothetical protein OXG81_00680 [Acidobacteria bacterium]|nr:hypothetical protein [Acidobacteriota bacterium]
MGLGECPCCSWDAPAAASCQLHVEKQAAPGSCSGCADLLVRLPPEAARNTPPRSGDRNRRNGS